MKTYKSKVSFWVLCLLTAFTCVLSSCSDDDSGNGQPVITGVRVCDPAYADSLFTKSAQGQVVAIIGQNLSGIQTITINGQKVSFSPTMNTDHSVIVTIPSESKGFVLTAFDSTLKDEIVIVTNHGTATYEFKVLAPGPQMQRIEGDYPRTAGDKLIVYGLNLVDIEKVYFTDITAEALDTLIWTEVPGNHVEAEYRDILQNHALNSSTGAYQTTSKVEVTVPEGAPETGALVLECAAGTVYLSYYRVPGLPVILSVSNDMPMVGETLVITGREFVQVESVSYGDVTLTADEFTVSQSQDSIYVKFPQKPSNGSSMTLSVTTPGGTATVDRFYDYGTLLTTFDNDDATDNGWGPNASYIDGGTADGKYAEIKLDNQGQSWWGTMVFFRKDWSGNVFTFSDNIPDEATTDELYFAFDVYDENSSFNNGSYWGYLRFELFDLNTSTLDQYDNFAWEDYDAGVGSFPDGPVLQDIDGKAHQNKWYRTVVPMSKFSNTYPSGTTLGSVRANGLAQWRIMFINQSTTIGDVNIKLDNVRIIYIPKK